MENKIEPALISVNEVCKLIGIGRTLFYSLRNKGDFAPLPVKLGDRTLYDRAEVEKWIAAKCPPRKQWIFQQRMK